MPTTTCLKEPLHTFSICVCVANGRFNLKTRSQIAAQLFSADIFAQLRCFAKADLGKLYRYVPFPRGISVGFTRNKTNDGRIVVHGSERERAGHQEPKAAKDAIPATDRLPSTIRKSATTKKNCCYRARQLQASPLT
jgi:hypothetical protein